MKKHLGTIAFLLVLAMLGGCGSNGNTADPTAEPTPTSAIQIPPGVAPVNTPIVDPSNVKAKGYEYDYSSLTYNLVWSDEFDVDGKPDTTKWNYQTGGGGWGNNELQTYTKGDNADVKDGVLTITLRKEENGKITSTRMNTSGKGDWTYGKFEIRAKLPSGKGTWPAIWMMPTASSYGGWPRSGEIDIMEHVGYHQNYVSSSVHTMSYYHKIGTQKTKETRKDGVSEEFHTYTLEWLPDKIITYVDDVKLFTFNPTQYKTNPTKDEWPFDKNFHLILNIAWGGDWGGAMGVDESALPTTMEVDYVRVYQSPEIEAAVLAHNK